MELVLNPSRWNTHSILNLSNEKTNFMPGDQPVVLVDEGLRENCITMWAKGKRGWRSQFGEVKRQVPVIKTQDKLYHIRSNKYMI